MAKETVTQLAPPGTYDTLLCIPDGRIGDTKTLRQVTVTGDSPALVEIVLRGGSNGRFDTAITYGFQIHPDNSVCQISATRDPMACDGEERVRIPSLALLLREIELAKWDRVADRVPPRRNGFNYQ